MLKTFGEDLVVAEGNKNYWRVLYRPRWILWWKKKEKLIKTLMATTLSRGKWKLTSVVKKHFVCRFVSFRRWHLSSRNVLVAESLFPCSEVGGTPPATSITVGSRWADSSQFPNLSLLALCRSLPLALFLSLLNIYIYIYIYIYI